MFINDIGSIIQSIIEIPQDILDYQQLKLKKLFSALKGNARVMMVTLPAFSFPQAWFLFYQQLYFLSLGVEKSQLGLLMALSLGTQVIGGILGPSFCNRWGHKKTLNLIGIIAWPAGLLTLAFAQNIWWIILGVMISNVITIVNPAWSCLFVEGIPRAGRQKNYAIAHMLITGASLTMPFAGWLVGWLDVKLATRIFYITGAVLAVWGIYYRHKYLVETREGKESVYAHKVLNPLGELKDILSSIEGLGRKKSLLWFIFVQMLFSFALTLWSVYTTVFLTDKNSVGLDASSISVFPILMSLILIFTILVVVPVVKKKEAKKYIFAGIILNAAAAFLFVVTPLKGTAYIALSYMLYGLGIAFFRPFSDSALLNLLSEGARTRLLSLSNTLVLLSSVFAGLSASVFYSISPILNFGVVTAVFLLAALIFWKKCKL